jgi:hypothetical protein
LGEYFKQALLSNVRRFLSEMAGDFIFISNQYRLELAGHEYFIDFLLFHRERSFSHNSRINSARLVVVSSCIFLRTR